MFEEPVFRVNCHIGLAIFRMLARFTLTYKESSSPEMGQWFYAAKSKVIYLKEFDKEYLVKTFLHID